ncbi:MAG: hypothetical protein HY962_15370 [Ignavibacteriae bacterium]|nr:hypothetical protein [Ignavibacteriota bacterium]
MILHLTAFAGFERRLAGARVLSLGSAGPASRWDPWSLNMNPACAGLAGRGGGVMALPSRFGLPELGGYAAVWSESYSSIGTGVLIETSGGALYRETQLVCGVAHDLGPAFRCGIALRYEHLGIARYGSDAAFAVDAGAVWRVGEKICVTAAVQNAGGTRYAGGRERPPLALLLGVEGAMGEDATVHCAVFKDVLHVVDVRAGVELRPHPLLALRVGAQTAPATFSAGAGFRWAGISADYAFVAHPELGGTHAFGVAIQLSGDEVSE